MKMIQETNYVIIQSRDTNFQQILNAIDQSEIKKLSLGIPSSKELNI